MEQIAWNRIGKKKEYVARISGFGRQNDSGNLIRKLRQSDLWEAAKRSPKWTKFLSDFAT